MPISNDKQKIVDAFLSRADLKSGSAILDLDGTAILEEEGKVFISGSVGKGLQEFVRIGRPVILNTLRFPLSVIRTVGHEWLDLSDERIPAICLNGSTFGYIERAGSEIVYDEAESFPLDIGEIDAVISGIDELLRNDVRDMVLFFYPRDWREGEIIWVPDEDRVKPLKEKYESASKVMVMPLHELRDYMIVSEPCMLFILVDRPKDKLMAYQHKEPSSFFTHSGVDKSSGLRGFAKILNVSLPDSMGAGNTAMDNFLRDVGLAVVVGHEKLSYSGLRETITVHDPIELGELMTALTDSAMD